MKFQTVCILGLGYIGLPTASTLAAAGVRVLGVDVNPQVVQSLQNGRLHLYEPDLGPLVENALRSGMLTVDSKPDAADAFIIAVPTPFYEDKSADLSYVSAAAESIVPYLRAGNLVMLESTSPPRTTLDVVLPILERSGLKAGADFYLAYSPERVLPGQILRELTENARVIGGIDPASSEAGRDLYQIFVKGEIYLTTATTAEMVKLMENTYRDVNIAIANEFSRLADRFGVDVWEAISLANKHPRVRILNPGPGVGGHCISVDPWFLVQAAPDLTPLIHTSRMVNDSQPDYVINLVERALGSDLRGRKIAALGLAFKPEVDDLRESPAVEVAHRLSMSGAEVTCFEPFKPDGHPTGLHTVLTLAEALQNAELVILLVGHSQFREMSAAQLAAMTPARIVIDCSGAWKGCAWEEAGFKLIRLGVG